jgi:hypothetical protein
MKAASPSCMLHYPNLSLEIFSGLGLVVDELYHILALLLRCCCMAEDSCDKQHSNQDVLGHAAALFGKWNPH